MPHLERPIYLDYNATTPLDPEVVAAMRPYLEAHFGNPSSSHWYGAQPRMAVAEARGQVAALLNCQPADILFTSGGTESNNHAIRGVARTCQSRGRHMITSQIEHPAVTEACRRLETEGFEVTYLPVDQSGLVSAADVEGAIRPDTILITLMHANNEVGTIQPIQAVSAVARRRGIVFHTDAAQSAGKIPTDVRGLGVDLLTLAGHKIYAPKGVGALYVREGLALERLLEGAGQEGGRRPGTENVLEIVGLGKACEVANRDLARNMSHMRARRDEIEQGLREKIADVRVNGHPELRLPNTSSVSIRGLDANDLLAEVGALVAASAGAACHSGEIRVSRVLRAMNVPEEWARGTLRLSTGRMTTSAQAQAAIKAIVAAAEKLRASA
ncbi:MAG: aminotransferase class V-fold PLP-dependent enzyme [Acidobacteria bacterium]|nr:aminotransferase class V-fold PLP-dependent enzyme [Acidobacteriota bacterium]